MSKKQVLLLTLLAVLPLIVFAWLGWRISRAETARVQQQLRLLLSERIGEENKKVKRYFAGLQRDLSLAVIELRDDATALRQWSRDTPIVRQTIVLDRSGHLVHPQSAAVMSDGERTFLAEIQQLLVDKDLIRLAFPREVERLGQQPQPPTDALATQLPTSRSKPPRVAAVRLDEFEGPTDASEGSSASPAVKSDEGWCTWYWGRGVNLMYWNRWDANRVTIVAVSRARWMADILSLLPSTPPTFAHESESSPQRIRLVDSSNQIVYQWGSFEPGPEATPLLDEPVIPPLSSWRFNYYVDPSAYSRSSQLPILASLAGLACALIGLILVLYRDYTRDMLEARQRVNFVNQVSHELKTPLTNIRLYADLLHRDLQQIPDEQLDKPRSRVEVISSEAQRLSRLIANVLTFARSERNQLQLRFQRVDLDSLVADIVERFEPLRSVNAIDLQLTCAAGEPLWIDPDAVEQILDNLISNVVRYASQGGYLGIRTQDEVDQVLVEVQDHGPGISDDLAELIFEPFVRGASGLSDATGTGIGLSIARRLAELHGGSLTLVPDPKGAVFRLVLPRRNHDESVSRGR